MSYMRIKCFNRQDKSTSIYYIYVLFKTHASKSYENLDEEGTEAVLPFRRVF